MADKEFKRLVGQLAKRAPEGVDPKKHERCVMDVKKQGKSVGSAHAICTSSMKKDEDDKGVKIDNALRAQGRRMSPTASGDGDVAFHSVMSEMAPKIMSRMSPEQKDKLKQIKDVKARRASMKVVKEEGELAKANLMSPQEAIKSAKKSIEDKKRKLGDSSGSSFLTPSKSNAPTLKPKSERKNKATKLFENALAEQVSKPTSSADSSKFSAENLSTARESQGKENQELKQQSDKMKEARQSLADSLLGANLIDAKKHKLLSNMDHDSFVNHMKALKQNELKEQAAKTPEEHQDDAVKRSQSKLARLMRDHQEAKDEHVKRLKEVQAEPDPVRKQAMWRAMTPLVEHAKKIKSKLDNHLAEHNALMGGK